MTMRAAIQINIFLFNNYPEYVENKTHRYLQTCTLKRKTPENIKVNKSSPPSNNLVKNK